MNYINIKKINVKSDLKNAYSKEKLRDVIYDVCKPMLTDPSLIAGKKVLIKPNLVRHFINEFDDICLTTNFNFIIEFLSIILELKPKKLVIGDAPIQGANWEKLISKDFADSIKFLSKKHNIHVDLVDFRRKILIKSKNLVIDNKRPLSDYVIFDLKTKSFLEPISFPKGKFRVTDYDPDRLSISHMPGVHKYCIAKELFNSDVVISLPKLKTHQKTGITCALKNLVGINGDKDYLPHHRVGGTGFGGDCYPGKNYFRRFSEYLLDNANKRIGYRSYWPLKYISRFFWKISFPTLKHQMAAGWHGNDTSWRMVLDLNLISYYGDIEGKIRDTKQRNVYSLCDAIIAGQGNGPLNPAPLPMGIIAFSNNSALMDFAMANLMGFDVEKIPLIKNSFFLFNNEESQIYFNDVNVDLNTLHDYSVKTNPAPGWIGEIEYEN